MLNKTLQKKWLPEKTVKQNRQLKKESENKLKQGPAERERSRKKAKQDQKIVRIKKQQPITSYTCKANHITNKMSSLAHTIYENSYDVIHITESGLQKKLPDIMKG